MHIVFCSSTLAFNLFLTILSQARMAYICIGHCTKRLKRSTWTQSFDRLQRRPFRHTLSHHVYGACVYSAILGLQSSKYMSTLLHYQKIVHAASPCQSMIIHSGLASGSCNFLCKVLLLLLNTLSQHEARKSPHLQQDQRVTDSLQPSA